MTRQQIAWASQHDWFIADNTDGTIDVADICTHNGKVIKAIACFSNFSELKAWAGY